MSSLVLSVMLTPFVFLFSSIYIFSEMVTERETRMKESLKIMGLNKWMYPLSFMVQRGLWLAFTCLCFTTMIYIFNTDVFGFGDFLAIYFSTWLLGLGNLSLCMVLQNLFSDAKMASFLAIFIIFGPVSLALIAIVKADPVNCVPNNWVQYLYFIPNFPFEVVLANIIFKDIVIEGFDGDITECYFGQNNVIAWIFLFIIPVFYYFVYIYVEAIMPQAYGVQMPCCYCFSKRKAEPVEDDESFDFDQQLLKSNMTNNTRQSTIQEEENESVRASGELDKALEEDQEA